MSAVSKLLPAVLVERSSSPSPMAHRPHRSNCHCHRTPPVAEQAPPARLPQQFFPEKKVQPLTPELEQALIIKDSFKERDACPKMVVVPKARS